MVRPVNGCTNESPRFTRRLVSGSGLDVERVRVTEKQEPIPGVECTSNLSLVGHKFVSKLRDQVQDLSVRFERLQIVV